MVFKNLAVILILVLWIIMVKGHGNHFGRHDKSSKERHGGKHGENMEYFGKSGGGYFEKHRGRGKHGGSRHGGNVGDDGGYWRDSWDSRGRGKGRHHKHHERNHCRHLLHKSIYKSTNLPDGQSNVLTCEELISRFDQCAADNNILVSADALGVKCDNSSENSFSIPSDVEVIDPNVVGSVSPDVEIDRFSFLRDLGGRILVDRYGRSAESGESSEEDDSSSSEEESTESVPSDTTAGGVPVDTAVGGSSSDGTDIFSILDYPGIVQPLKKRQRDPSFRVSFKENRPRLPNSVRYSKRRGNLENRGKRDLETGEFRWHGGRHHFFGKPGKHENEFWKKLAKYLKRADDAISGPINMCLLQKSGILDGAGKVDSTELKKILDIVYVDYPEVTEMVMSNVEACNDTIDITQFDIKALFQCLLPECPI